MENIRVVLIHGNGGGTPTDNWLPYLKEELEKMGVPVISPQFPDHDLARESYWIPFLEKDLKVDQNTILIGHSSGAVVSMRFAEKHKIFGSIIIGAYYTDLGYEKEKLSGYFNHPWDWESIKKNQNWIIEFASTDDPWIPIEEPRYIHKKLNTEYYEYHDQGHFGGDYHKITFPEVVKLLENKLLNFKPPTSSTFEH